jgi:hypothetical protein
MFGGMWPLFAPEYSDLAQYADEAWWKLERAAERNARKQLPSANEITFMESAGAHRDNERARRSCWSSSAWLRSCARAIWTSGVRHAGCGCRRMS